MVKSLLRPTLSAAAGILLAAAAPARAQLMITGNDEKVSFDENIGKAITHPAGKDTVSIIDIADPAKPKIIDANIDILRVDGDALTKVADLALPGHPASRRGGPP